jgi:hypothetical protein
MPGFSGTVSGGPATVRAFDQLAQDVANLGPQHERIARARLSGVAARTPVRSGQLAGSWDATATDTGGAIVSPLDYAGVIEYGSSDRGITAAAMVARTLEADTAAILAEYEQAIRDRAKARGFRVV